MDVLLKFWDCRYGWNENQRAQGPHRCVGGLIFVHRLLWQRAGAQ